MQPPAQPAKSRAQVAESRAQVVCIPFLCAFDPFSGENLGEPGFTLHLNGKKLPFKEQNGSCSEKLLPNQESKLLRK
jgi:nitrite reductase/ring-hydroxylating ferredoxin subunit